MLESKNGVEVADQHRPGSRPNIQNRPPPGGAPNVGALLNLGKHANNPLTSLFPTPKPLQSLIPTNLPADIEHLGSFLANPFPTLASLLPKPFSEGLESLFPRPTDASAPPPKSPNHINGKPASPKVPPFTPPFGQSKQHPPGQPPPLNKGPKQGPPGHEPQCTQQEVSCPFLRDAAYQMQNDDDECLKLATSFDENGKIHFEPIAQDGENVIYGLTTDGLTASAWCNDIGWALRKIYINCRRGTRCFGGKTIIRTSQRNLTAE
jgi:hypothetical protein